MNRKARLTFEAFRALHIYTDEYHVSEQSAFYKAAVARYLRRLDALGMTEDEFIRRVFFV